ncbi:MAG TPA: hydroxyacid dehydrogenase [Terriglobales bacterium]|nr:hydroxyacid dehydrogenase [Terriglobales bacterium]
MATGPVPPITRDILGRFGAIYVAPETSEQSLISVVGDAIGLIVRGNTPVSRRVVEAGKYLRVIGRSGVGCDNVDVAAATELGIPVVFTPGAASRAVAEGAMAYTLALAKHLNELDQRTKAGDWESRDQIQVFDLQGATLGIIGLGRIGQDFARLLQPFGMRVLAFDPYVPSERAKDVSVELVELDTLFTQSDFVVLVAPLTNETQGIVNRSRIASMKTGAILINVGRGKLLESLDIVFEALESGKLSAAGLDVFLEEPPDVSHPLFSHPKLLCSPHILGLSVSATQSIFKMMSDGMAAVLDGKMPANVINPDVFQMHPARKEQ